MVDVNHQQHRKRLSRLLLACLAVVGIVIVSGLFGTVVGLVVAFGAVGDESVDPSQKARILAEGISEAMNCTAFGVVFGLAVGVPLLVWWLRLERRRGDPDDETGQSEDSTGGSN